MIPLLTVMGVPIHTAFGTCLAFVACASLGWPYPACPSEKY